MQQSLLDAALAYAARGWPIFPCKADKTPAIPREKGGQGVLDATTDPETIRRWWTEYPRAGIGLDVGGAGLMVLDGDQYKPDYDHKAVAALNLPETQLRQRSPRGGVHWFYALAPGEIAAPSSSKLAKGLDVRSFHSYVLLTPSATADGEYTWESEGKPAFRSDEMLRLTNTAREKSEDRDNWLIEPDMPENVAAAIEWLKTTAQIAVEGQGGEFMAYKTAAMMKSFGISEALAFDLIWEHWNPRCIPPWSADEVEHIEARVKRGYTYNTSPPGNVTAAFRVAKSAAMFKPVLRSVSQDDAGGIEATNGRFRFLDRGGLDSIKPPRWLVQDFIPEGGYGLLVGPAGTFKTFIAIDIALTVAAGNKWPWPGPWEANQHGAVLFAAGEGRPGFKKRVQAWEKTYLGNTRAESFVLVDPVPAPRPEDWEHFIAGAKAMRPEGYRLVVLDTVGRSMQGMNENSQEDASQFTALVEIIQRELGAAVLGLHHTGHEANRARGSSVFGADADTIVNMERQGKELIVSLSMTKQKDAPEWAKPIAVKLNELAVGKDDKTLVAAKPAPAEVVSRDTSKAREAAAESTIQFVVDASVVAVLASNKLKEWNTKELAEALAMRDEVGLSSKTLAQHNLVSLRETKGTRASKMYDPSKKRWRFSD